MDELIEREDVDAILSGVFEINANLVEIRDDVQIIRRLLGDADEQEEEEDS